MRSLTSSIDSPPLNLAVQKSGALLSPSSNMSASWPSNPERWSFNSGSTCMVYVDFRLQS